MEMRREDGAYSLKSVTDEQRGIGNKQPKSNLPQVSFNLKYVRPIKLLYEPCHLLPGMDPSISGAPYSNCSLFWHARGASG